MLNVVPWAPSDVPGERPHRQQPHLGRDADQLAVRGDGAGHGGAMHMRGRGGADHVVLARDHAGKIGMLGVDLGIDHRHDHVVPVVMRCASVKCSLGTTYCVPLSVAAAACCGRP